MSQIFFLEMTGRIFGVKGESNRVSIFFKLLSFNIEQ